MTTNLKPAKNGKKGTLDWVFDLDGIKDMYSSYEMTNLWPMLETQPKGLEVDFIRAERSAVRLGGRRRKQIIKHWCKNSLLRK